MMRFQSQKLNPESTEVLSAEPISKKLKLFLSPWFLSPFLIEKWESRQDSEGSVKTPAINLELDSKILAKFCMWHMKY